MTVVCRFMCIQRFIPCLGCRFHSISLTEAPGLGGSGVDVYMIGRWQSRDSKWGWCMSQHHGELIKHLKHLLWIKLCLLQGSRRIEGVCQPLPLIKPFSQRGIKQSSSQFYKVTQQGEPGTRGPGLSVEMQKASNSQNLSESANEIRGLPLSHFSLE